MPRKRKAEEEITIKTRVATKAELESATVTQPVQLEIRCIYDANNLIIGSDKTPSGTRYEFRPGEVKPVNIEDYHYLLAMQTRPLGCCGGSMKPQNFFEEV